MEHKAVAGGKKRLAALQAARPLVSFGIIEGSRLVRTQSEERKFLVFFAGVCP
jgi:hypothetical protein